LTSVVFTFTRSVEAMDDCMTTGIGKEFALGHSPCGLLPCVFVLVSALVLTPSVLADGTITGHGRFERIKGRPAMGYVELYESNLFLSPDGGGPRGPSFRLGAPPGQAPRGDGFYSLTVPAGSWSLLVNQPLFFIRPRVLGGLAVSDGRTTTQHVELPIDYSTFFTDTWTSFNDVWVETFTATGTAVTGVSWKLAGTNANEVEASVLADDGGPNPVLWPLASATARKRDSVAAVTDNWVRWRSGEVPTVPGRRYAIRLTGTAGGDRRFAVFNRAKDANSYAGGSAYGADGLARTYDLNITVFADNDGTAVLLNKTTEGLGELLDSNYGGRWGQTFAARAGSSLAAVDVWAAGADNNWDLDFTWRVFRGGPGGAQVGPAKTTRAAFQAFGAGLHGVSYTPGEVPLAAGETYYVELTNSPGFNPYVMRSAADSFAGGAAYQDRSIRASMDLSMTVVVYTERGGTVSGRVIEAGSGAALSAATVSVVELGRSAATAGDGRYELNDVPEGTYSLRASRPGYTSVTRGGVVVRVGETTSADFSLEREPCALQFQNPSFEGGLVGWTRFGAARNEVVDTSGGGWFADIRARDGNRFHGNAINGCCLDRGGLAQQLCAVPGHRYVATVWSNIYWISGDPDDATSRIGIDPSGGTSPDGPVVWSAVHRQSAERMQAWRQIQVEVRAAGPLLTVFLEFRQLPASGNQWRINCFDLVEVRDLDEVVEPVLRRGDCDASAEADISDAIFLLNHLFTGGREPDCLDACDSNDDGAADLSDASFLLNYLFTGGRVPPPPGPDACGVDETEDGLGCEGESGC
jgi:hypothetical protein